MTSSIYIIPPITDEIGRGWNQPRRSEISILDDEYCIMSKRAFDILHEYGHSVPTGVYTGKMWRSEGRSEQYYLYWFGEKAPLEMLHGKEGVKIHHRKILIVSTQGLIAAFNLINSGIGLAKVKT